jgi:hypothetical protein
MSFTAEAVRQAVRSLTEVVMDDQSQEMRPQLWHRPKSGRVTGVGIYDRSHTFRLELSM